MKNKISFRVLISIFALLLVLGVSTSADGQVFVEDDQFSKLTLQASLNKDRFVPLEPIFLSLRLFNGTPSPLSTISLPSFEKIVLRVRKDKNSRSFSGLFFTGPPREGLGRIFKPGASLNDQLALTKDLDLMLSEEGKYLIQFELTNSAENKIQSNEIEIWRVEPNENERLAIAFLKEHSTGELFWWKDSKSGQVLLESFVERFQNTVFGEFAILKLGFAYISMGDCEKGREVLSKIRNSDNPYLSTQVKSLLGTTK